MRTRHQKYAKFTRQRKRKRILSKGNPDEATVFMSLGTTQCRDSFSFLFFPRIMEVLAVW